MCLWTKVIHNNLKEIAMEKWIIIIGNPCEGFEFIGPFDSLEEAARHGNQDGNIDQEWWTAKLDDPQAQ